MRILLTRPREDAEPFARLLAARGVDCLIEPLLEVRFLAAGPPDTAGVQAILLTSANAARALQAACGGVVPPAMRSLPAFAVGAATAAAARAAGLAVAGDADGDAAALAALVATRLSPEAGALLHVRAHQVAGDLSGRLQTAGFTVRPALLYRTDARTELSPEVRAALRDGILDGVALFSPRTASAFDRLLRGAGLAARAGSLNAYCLSPAVAEAAARLAWRGVLVAVSPNAGALADLIAGRAGGSPHEVMS